MSRSNPQLKNPAVRYLSWSGGEKTGGQITYWDKAAEERKVVELPFSFLVLDELNTVGGYSDHDKSSFWANEVRDMKKSTLTVRTSAGVKARGLYANISDEIKAKGAKYAKAVYIAFKDDTGEMAIAKLSLTGAALTAWIEFNKKFDVYKCATLVEGGKKAKKGANVYYTPIFEGQNVSEDSNKAAAALDTELQAYFKSYFSYDSNDGDPVDDEDNSPMRPSRQVNADEVKIEDADDSGSETEEDGHETPAKSAKSVEGIPLKDVPF